MSTVLLIDDDGFVHRLVGRFLRDVVTEILYAKDGYEGLRMVKNHPTNVILLDMNMPGMTGDHICRVLKRDERTRHIPVLFLTASEDDDMITLAEKSGADGYILKPFNKPQLQQRVQEYLGRASSTVSDLA